MEQHHVLNQIKVERLNLLKVLEENKIKHVEEYKLAIVEFRKAVIKEMTELLASISAGGTLAMSLRQNVNMPQSHEKDYARAIKKFSMSVDEFIYLDDAHFDQYVMDNWQWKAHTSNQFYASNSR